MNASTEFVSIPSSKKSRLGFAFFMGVIGTKVRFPAAVRFSGKEKCLKQGIFKR